jgi:fructosamine-3-kinase
MSFETDLEEQLGAGILGSRSAGGGCIADARVVELEDGRRIFVKTHPDGARMFPAEADGLRWLAEPDVIRIPAVLAVGPDATPYLALEFIDSGPGRGDTDEKLGRGLAKLHRFGAPSFGHRCDNFVGSLPQTGEGCETWPEFYATQRLDPLVRRAIDDGSLPGVFASEFERLYARLPQRCGPAEPPSRLHGDLWSGNAMTARDGAPVLIDPAVYGGHREIDLGMMKLFGGFSQRCFAAYDEEYPLAEGWESRVPLYQLYPLLVHVCLFGGSYVGQLRRALNTQL